MRALALVALVCGAVSCGPASYLYSVTNKASRALAEAETSGAEKLAPYEYWSAVTYLRMAREKAGEADYELAVAYGDKSAEMSNEASAIARRRAASGGPGSVGPPSSAAGADAEQ